MPYLFRPDSQYQHLWWRGFPPLNQIQQVQNNVLIRYDFHEDHLARQKNNLQRDLARRDDHIWRTVDIHRERGGWGARAGTGPWRAAHTLDAGGLPNNLSSAAE